jgi:two-component system response regulator
MSSRDREVLLVEDSPGDVMLVREAMSALAVTSRLHVFGDGAEALKFLGGEDEYAGAPNPDLILLDLNLPVMDGREALQNIKQHPQWKRIPVAVLSTSDSEEDIASSYDLLAACYIVKPMDIQSFREVIRAIDDFWLSVVRFPSKH